MTKLYLNSINLFTHSFETGDNQRKKKGIQIWLLQTETRLQSYMGRNPELLTRFELAAGMSTVTL